VFSYYLPNNGYNTGYVNTGYNTGYVNNGYNTGYVNTGYNAVTGLGGLFSYYIPGYWRSYGYNAVTGRQAFVVVGSGSTTTSGFSTIFGSNPVTFATTTSTTTSTTTTSTTTTTTTQRPLFLVVRTGAAYFDYLY
jgi:hypothetical protein